MSEKFIARVRVRSYELDSFGHVNNAVYLQYLEYARCEYMRQRQLSFNDFKKWNAVPYVVGVEISYKSSCRADDELEIEASISQWGRGSFVMEYTVHNLTSGRVAATARMKFAFVDSAEKIIAVPEIFRKAMGG